MSATLFKCPVCKFQESIMSSRPTDVAPPCPRCVKFVRMVAEDGPRDGEKTLWSSGGPAK